MNRLWKYQYYTTGLQQWNIDAFISLRLSVLRKSTAWITDVQVCNYQIPHIFLLIKTISTLYPVFLIKTEQNNRNLIEQATTLAYRDG